MGVGISFLDAYVRIDGVQGIGISFLDSLCKD
jgi:hypothetical protein